MNASAANARAVLRACTFLAAIVLACSSVRVHLARGCDIQDTPYLALCEMPLPGSTEDLERTRSRIARNPGDAPAYIHLAIAGARLPQHESLVRAAAAIAPNEPNVLALVASRALARQDWQAAVGPLVTLATQHKSDPALVALAQLAGLGEERLFDPYIDSAQAWLPWVLKALPAAQVPPGAAVPLVIRALRKQVLGPDDVRPFVRELKAKSQWADAYGVWLATHPHDATVLYNAGFDRAFESDGFDWELSEAPPSWAGSIAQRAITAERGGILNFRFTGRRLQIPLVRQALFLGLGKYRLEGEFQTSRLLIPEGLAWTVRCARSQAEAGRSVPLTEEGAAWRPFAMEFSIPTDCGAVAWLQLETATASASAATAGGRGTISFDNFRMTRLPN